MSTLVTILVLQVAYVSLLTIRFILMVRGIRYVAALISAIEIGIYVLGFTLVLNHLDHPINLIVYCLSYSLGILVGTKLEERLALGYVTVQVVTKDSGSSLAERLRNMGYGVTTWIGAGLDGERWVLSTVAPRRHQSQLYQDILAVEPDAFIVSYEPKLFHGGFLTHR